MTTDGGEQQADYQRIYFVASTSDEAMLAKARLTRLYGACEAGDAEVIVALGGDGLMLQTLHQFIGGHIPIYGMNRGSVGFLMNEYQEAGLHERLRQAKLSVIHPLKMRASDSLGYIMEALAINEVSVFRQTFQAARLRISVDDQVRLEELICDGALVATPAGSTAYNLSVGGPILPVKSPLLALTPISPFRPRRWRGALIPNNASVRFEALEAAKRPVNAVADHTEFRNVVCVDVAEAPDISLKLLFDPHHALDERILAEQFRY
ncbi:MAG: NAD kinase [Chitinophagales bacterium]|nr:NAD kinase [Hyphomicrobiales bacterium]